MFLYKRIITIMGVWLLFNSTTTQAAVSNLNNPVSPAASPNTQSVVLGGSPTLTNRQLELQLKQQALQLEQQLLQVRERLLQLERLDALQQRQPTQPSIDLHWINASGGKVPANAIVAGYTNNQPLNICHANYLGGVHPGQLVVNGCLISYGGRAFIQTDYQVLTGKHPVQWKAASELFRFTQPLPTPITPFGPVLFSQAAIVGGDISQQSLPIQGGYENSRSLYICRAMFENNIHLGKVVSNNCNMSWQGAEIRVPTYEVLFD